jgi:hypothetical protein
MLPLEPGYGTMKRVRFGTSADNRIGCSLFMCGIHYRHPSTLLSSLRAAFTSRGPSRKAPSCKVLLLLLAFGLELSDYYLLLLRWSTSW